MSVTLELLERVRERLQSLGLSTSAYRIAKVLDVTQSTTSNWINGKTGMSEAYVVKACEWLYGDAPDLVRLQEHWLCLRRAELADDEAVAGVWQAMAESAYAAANKYYVKSRAWLRWLAIGAGVALAGCAHVPPVELAWQTAHALDMAQTINGPARDSNCFTEADPLTRSAIGSNPSTEAVVGYFVTTAALHYLGSRWLERTDAIPPKLKHALRGLDLSVKLVVVAENHDRGIRPFGDNRQHAGCR